MSGGVDERLAGAQAQKALVVVAHPDDETLWAGGLLLSHPHWQLSILSMCRGSDPDRAPRFRALCDRLGAQVCLMGDLDDGPEQLPLSAGLVEASLRPLIPEGHYHLLITHSPNGEYTSHRRHEETARVVGALWARERIDAEELWMFAYDDAGRTTLPTAIPGADLLLSLDEETFRLKRELITGVYGFGPESWEARAVSRVEAFWRFNERAALQVRFGIGLAEEQNEEARP